MCNILPKLSGVLTTSYFLLLLLVTGRSNSVMFFFYLLHLNCFILPKSLFNYIMCTFNTNNLQNGEKF